ncbi:dihydrolipoamide dehydrogenase [Pseudorhodobacter sp. E13]|uniref:dihydrolipoyl dehydrogenase family protein n=1 Tax=Pseudorhodobacter sp. E13 TaxID=2487931 RepID=UPI000F8D22C5|nr:FAD-dependent oxidoreductase [Pseudorhodobacter sp. E13]RUS58604.1 dihydrolipoamide dehydrogenase [Pseudorhodobacter sp. E13]
MEQIKTDICIIGAGSGGLSIAAGAVQMGARVVLIEGGEMGGDCLNAGCVPSKALIAAAKHAHAMTTGGPFGITPTTPQVDFGAVKDHVRRVIEGIAPVDSQERFEGLGVRVIRDWAKFDGPEAVIAGNHRITARRIVIATGSRPFVPPIPGVDSVPYLTNETIFAQRERPEHLIVIGGGPIGMEMAQAHRRLGCAVTVIEGAKAFGRDDPETAAVVLKKLRAEGVEVMEEAPVVRIGGTAGAIEVEIKDGRIVKGSHLLMAVGRQVSLDGLELEKAGVDYTRKGVTVGADLRSSNRKVYAVGDAAGGLQFTHVAGYHAGIVIRQMLFGLPSKASTAHIPWATYTDPELAQIGPTEAEARKQHGDAVQVVRFEYAENDRAQTEGKTEGLIKVMVLKGRPIGVSIAGAQAGELIGFWALAIAAKLKMSAIAGTVLPYPTLNEVSKRAAGAYFSPRLFDNPMVKRVVGLVQRFLP